MRYIEPFIKAFMEDTDLSLLKQNLKLSPQERFDKFTAIMQSVVEVREQAAAARKQQIRSTGEPLA